MRDNRSDTRRRWGVLLLAALAALVALSGCRNVTPADEPDDTAPSFGDATVADQTYTVGVETEPLQLPAATGGNGELTYALAPAVSGLSFDAATRTLSGTPGEAGTYSMTYTATDADDNTDAADAATLTFTITAAPPEEPDTAPSFGDATVADQAYVVGKAIADLVLPEANGGNASLRYSLTPAVPGLRFYPSTRTLSGRPIATAEGTHAMTYHVEDSDGDAATLIFTIAVETDPDNRAPYVSAQMNAPPLQVRGGPGPKTVAVAFILVDFFDDPDDDPLTFKASSSNEAVATAVVGPLPEVAEDKDVLEVAAVGLGEATITVTATDPSGASATQEFTVSVVADPDTSPYFGDATVTDQTYTVGVEIEPLQLPAATGGDGELTYALAPAVPGLSFDAATRTLSGTPGEAGTYVMSYTAMDADDNTDTTDTATLTFTITAAPRRISDISNTYRGHGDEVFHLNPDGAPLVDTGYTLELGSASPEVYLIATNTNAYRAISTIERLDAGRGADINGAVDESRLWQRSGPRAWRPQVSEFNNNPPLGRAVAPGISYSRPQPVTGRRSAHLPRPRRRMERGLRSRHCQASCRRRHQNADRMGSGCELGVRLRALGLRAAGDGRRDRGAVPAQRSGERHP